MKLDTKQFRVRENSSFHLARFPTEIKRFAPDRETYDAEIRAQVEKLGELQERLAADKRWAVLLIFQGMDTSGKDGAIKAVTTGVNPAGFQVESFKKPSSLELRHDWMWRTNAKLPEKGRIGIFNRSQYEELAAVKVHPHFLDAQGIPERFRGDGFFKRRAEALVANEAQLLESGTRVIKFFLHLSKDEQAKRLLERGNDPQKLWKFDVNDLREREFWKEYQEVWSDAIRRTSTKENPWFVIPADNKRAARIAIARIVVEEMKKLGLEYPELPADQKKAIRAGLLTLEKELRGKTRR